jgi:transposase
VDRGVVVAVALSTGELSSPAGLRPKEAERLLRLQRRLARARRGSNRRAEVKQKIARLRAREADRRKDWVEKTSTGLARRFDVIRVEDLRVNAMTRSAKGTLDAPGRNVRPRPGSTGASWPRAGVCSWPAWRTRRPAGSSGSTRRTRRRPAMPAGIAQRRTARAKRSSGAWPAGTGPTPT